MSAKKPKRNDRQGEFTPPEFGRAEKAKEKLIDGVPFDVVTSAVQKSIRTGDELAATYWALALYEKAPRYCWKRLLVCAAEDVGLADIETVSRVYSLAAGWKVAKDHSWFLSPHALTLAVVMLCRAKKSTWIEDFQSYIMQAKRKGSLKLPVLPEYTDQHTREGRARGANDADWYFHRHVTCSVPINAWTKRLWELCPEWRSWPEGEQPPGVTEELE